MGQPLASADDGDGAYFRPVREHLREIEADDEAAMTSSTLSTGVASTLANDQVRDEIAAVDIAVADDSVRIVAGKHKGQTVTTVDCVVEPAVPREQAFHEF